MDGGRMETDGYEAGTHETAHDYDLIDIARLRAGGSMKWSQFPDTIGAFVAEMDFGTAPVITEALHGAVDAHALGYLPTALADELGRAAADFQRDAFGWPVDAQQIHPIADVVRGLELVIEHYTSPGSAVILPIPAYMPFLLVPQLMQRRLITVPMIEDAEGYRLDLDGLHHAFADGGELLIMVNPHNPTGRVFRTDELAAVAEVVDHHHGRVYADEIHAPLVYPGAQHVNYAAVSEVAAGHTITAISASKAWNLPGLKCAQLIIGDSDAERWEEFGEFASHGASTLGVIASTVAYRSARPWLAGLLEYLESNRRRLGELLTQECPEIGFRPPQGTYIGWLDCRRLDLQGQTPDVFFRERAGVALTGGQDSGAPGFARIVFATPAPVLEQAVRQLGAALR